MEMENKYLQLEGLVSPETMSKFSGAKDADANSGWFFVDYSPKDYPVHSRFDLILSGTNRTIIPQIFDIKLLEVLDQFGNNLNSIAIGTKTICRFLFSPSVPDIINKLPVLNYWKFNKDPLIIANHNEIKVDNVNPVSTDTYVEILDDVVSVFVSFATADKRSDSNDFSYKDQNKLKTEIMSRIKQKRNKEENNSPQAAK